jgi:protein-tyrosine phosphatase
MNKDIQTISEVISNKLYLTCWNQANDKSVLQKYRITHLVNASQLKNSFSDEFIYLKIDVEDDEKVNIKQYFSRVNRFIYNAILKGGVVLVYCFAGMSRSPCLIAAYLIRKKKETLLEALKLIKEVRKCIDINEGFRIQLEEYSKE